MKRLAILALLILLAAHGAFAQAEPQPSRGGEEGGSMGWLWVNFVILAGGLAWVFKKSATPYFVSRALQIRKRMIEAGDARSEAERRLADVEARLAHLDADVQALREEAAAEQSAASERAREETAAVLAKIRARAEQETASAVKAARLELKRYSAALAVGLAEQKIRARMTAREQEALAEAFVYHLRHAASRAQST